MECTNARCGSKIWAEFPEWMPVQRQLQQFLSYIDYNIQSLSPNTLELYLCNIEVGDKDYGSQPRSCKWRSSSESEARASVTIMSWSSVFIWHAIGSEFNPACTLLQLPPLSLCYIEMTSRLPKLVAFDLEYVVPDDIGKGLVSCIVGCQPHRR